MNSMRKIYLICVLCVLPIVDALCQKMNQTEVSSRMRKGVLPNGLSYFVVRNNIPEGKIEFSFLDRTGFYNEARSERGLSHLVEHIGMRSTRHFPEGLKRYFLAHGLSTGQNINASTTDITNYSLAIPSNDPVLYESSFQALMDWSCGISFLPDEVDEERAAVANEYDITKDSVSQAFFTSQYFLLDRNPLFARTMDSIDLKNVASTSIADIKKFYDRRYIPGQQAIVIVGDLDEYAVERKIREMFLGIRDGVAGVKEVPTIDGRYDMPLTGNNKLVTLTHGSRDPSINIRVYVKEKHVMSQSPDKWRIDVADLVFNQLLSNRRRQAAFGDHDVSMALQRRAINEMAQVDAFSTKITVTSKEEIKTAIELSVREMKRIERWGFSEVEFRNAINDIKSMFRSESYRKSSSISARIINAFSGAGDLPPDDVHILSFLEEITVREINERYRKWMDLSKNVDIFISLPNRTLQRRLNQKEVFSWVENAAKETIKNVSSKRQILKLAEPSIPPDTQDYVTYENTNSGMTDLKFRNGIRVLIDRLGPRDNAKESWNDIAIKCFKPIAVSPGSIDKSGKLYATAEIISSSKIANFSTDELAAWKEMKNAAGFLSLTAYDHADQTGFVGGCSLDNLSDVLKMIYYYSSNFKIDPAAVEKWKKRRLSSRAVKKTPFQVFEDSIKKVVHGYQTGEDSKLESITVAEVQSIYELNFKSTQDFTFVISGYFEYDDVIPLVNRYLGSIHTTALKSRGSKALNDSAATELHHPNPKARFFFKRDSIGNANVQLFFGIARQMTFKETLEMQVANELLRRALLRRLRERERGVYYVVCGIHKTSISLPGFIGINFESAPEKVDFLVNAAVDEIKHLAENVDGSVFSAALTAVQNREKISLTYSPKSADNVIAQVRAGYVHPGSNINEQIFKEMTLTDVRNALRELVDVDHSILFTLF
jgi:zinc protease